MRRLFVVVGALGCVVQGMAAAQTVAVSGSNRTVDVTVTERVVVPADIGTVHIGFQLFGASQDAAYRDGSRVSNNIVRALEQAGVAADALESETQAVAAVPAYEQGQTPPDERARRQFQVSQSWTVRVPADTAARVLDVAVRAGANQSGQIEWSLRDQGAADAAAASKALQHAHSNAEAMAGSLHARLGALLYASNEAEGTPVRPMARALAASAASLQKVEPLAIHPRQIERSATVHAIFALE